MKSGFRTAVDRLIEAVEASDYEHITVNTGETIITIPRKSLLLRLGAVTLDAPGTTPAKGEDR